MAQTLVLKPRAEDEPLPVPFKGNDPALTQAVAADIRSLRREAGTRYSWGRNTLEYLMSMGLTQPDPAERRVLLRHALYYCHPAVLSR